ncbi:MAG TPA: MlaD family protein [Kiritimatiellia bacterium]|nr:MlaD family protein [Kiritimatiellia bacterium]HMO99610.1 MlaD family protein [Kiritimatiellia bacterium]HMP96709.1 MlaD family protein [Kiritimatiellia bacterium]
MSKKANPAVVGSFVMGAIAISIIGVMLLGGGAFMQEKITGIMYFDESISGLDVGAPVDFQGVRIGTVTGVRMEMEGDESGAVYRPVTFQIEFNRIHFRSERRGRGQEMYDNIERLVQEKGLRARLATQSILTGRLKIEMGYFPDTAIERKNRDPDSWELPTIPSPLSMAKQDIQELPLNEIVQEAYRALKNMADLLDPEKTGQTVANLNRTLSDIDQLLNLLKTSIEPVTTEGVGVMQDMRRTFQDTQALLVEVDKNMRPLLENMAGTSERINIMLDPKAPMRGEITQLLGEMRETSRSIRLFMEHLEQQPESLLRGRR